MKSISSEPESTKTSLTDLLPPPESKSPNKQLLPLGIALCVLAILLFCLGY